MLDRDIRTIKGVGEKIAEKLNHLGVKTVEQLIYFFPRRYDDYSHLAKIADLKPGGQISILGEVESVSSRKINHRLNITEAVIADETSKIKAVWFNQPYRTEHLKSGEKFYFSGLYDFQRNRYVLQNPVVEAAKNVTVNTARIVPIYPETRGIKSHQIRKVVHEILPLINALPETLPPEIISKYNLMSISQAISNIHFPNDSDSLDAAKHRVAFEELLWLMTASVINKAEHVSLEAHQIPFSADIAQQFTSLLSFKMTDAQRRAAWEILQDIANETPMNRMLQGDVGSGKTVVAAMTAFMAARAGRQAAILAPTEILATQHAESFAKLLEPVGLNIGLLIGSTPKSAKLELKKRLKQGEIDVIIGTHAIIQKDSEFARLGLVVIDEQHRFGVNQRQELLDRGDKMPHLLSMTATPIPRSLQLTVYGEMEVSIIGELPKGRQLISTKVVAPISRHEVYDHIREQIQAGAQAYIICPLVSQDILKSPLKNVEDEFERLANREFYKHRVGMVHGQMKPAQKDAVMQQFKNHEIDILVSTTVVEVGVDVPNATVMLIEGAERFGLAQLHQLRGRVGRGQRQSFCYLVPTDEKSVSKRLREMERVSDGFKLAEIDLKLRGPGQIYGRAQHGALDFTFANLTDVKLLKQVREAAEQLVKTHVNLLQYPKLHKHVQHYRRMTTLN